MRWSLYNRSCPYSVLFLIGLKVAFSRNHRKINFIWTPFDLKFSPNFEFLLLGNDFKSEKSRFNRNWMLYRFSKIFQPAHLTLIQPGKGRFSLANMSHDYLHGSHAELPGWIRVNGDWTLNYFSKIFHPAHLMGTERFTIFPTWTLNKACFLTVSFPFPSWTYNTVMTNFCLLSSFHF